MEVFQPGLTFRDRYCWFALFLADLGRDSYCLGKAGLASAVQCCRAVTRIMAPVAAELQAIDEPPRRC